MKKRLFIIVLSVILAAVFAAQPTAKAASETAENHKEYISEVKIGVGKTESEAASSLDGYTILSDNGKNVDLNQGAGGGIGSKGDRVVYLGYKTTTDRREAITDLAVMNMKGGYSVKDYELLMQQYMTEQIIPFVDNFLAAILEYRVNYASDNAENKARAKYVHDALNKLTDDDCGDAGLGDLLLNETKYEMGDEAYEALSDEEKAKHADILTIISQANGKATFVMENLITRAADTSEDSWIDRFVATSYDDLLTLYPDMLPTDAAAQLAKDYDNDAREILSMWSAFKEQLDGYEENIEVFDELSDRDLTGLEATVSNFDPDTATDEQIEAFAEAYVVLDAVSDTTSMLGTAITVKEYLETVPYGEGSLFDFFDQDTETVKNDVTVLYPLVASLSAGQRAGLKFVTLLDLITYAATDREGYKDAETDDLVSASVYENVDREIFKAGGVALTNEALRAHAAEEAFSEDSKFSTLTNVMQYVAAGSLALFAATALVRLGDMAIYNTRLAIINHQLNNLQNQLKMASDYGDRTELNVKINWLTETKEGRTIYGFDGEEATLRRGMDYYYGARSSVLNKLLLGFGIAAVVLSAAALYLSYRDLVDYYNVDYTPIPKYIVDEKDITVYNEKGEKTVIKNLAAYYKAVETNRAEGDEWYDILGASSDLNGTVGRQWLALYAAKNENESPILASSLKAVTGSDKVPADYTTGIHIFGSEAAYNLNNTQFVWNNEAKSVFVYFASDVAAEPSTKASAFSVGYTIIAILGGLFVGMAATLCITVIVDKKRRNGKKQ